MTNGLYLLALFTLTAALPASAATPTILPMGDSITFGIDYTSGSSGGYRDPLYKALSSAGIAFTFVGANNGNATPALSAAGQTYHDGFGGWHIADMNANLDGVANPIGGGNGNLGGYLLTGSHGTGRAAVSPDYILLHLGTNDFLQETANPEADLQTLVTHIHALCPNTVILVASVVPINSASFTGTVNTFNAYIQYTLVPSLSYLRFVDEHAAFLNADGTTNASLIGNDLVHPTGAGYAAMAAVWANALKGVIGGTTPTPTPAPTPIPAPAPTPTTFTLTVEGGTGSGTYPSGTSVTVAADAAAGAYSFFSWQGSTTGLTSSTSATTSLLMPSANATLVATYALPETTSTPTPTPPAPGTSLGVFALLNQSAPTGNSLNVEYGVSSEGGRVITYWSTTTPGFKLLSEGSGKYEITENIGGRCLTLNGTSIATNTCSSAANQLFSLLPQTDGSYAIQNGNECVAAAGSFQVVNAMPCAASATQHWVFSGPTPLVLPSATGTIVNSPTVPSGYHLVELQ